MTTSGNNHRNLLDLPNEILLIIFKKLNMVDVLYSLVDIDERLNQLILHPLYLRHLDMTSMTMKSMFDRTFSIDNQVLDRICQDILPRIYHLVCEITIEQHCMERVLRTINYPQLHSLSLINFSEKTLYSYLTDHTILRRHLLTGQITHLTIDIHDNSTQQAVPETVLNIFLEIVSSCVRLIDLNFCSLYHQCSNISLLESSLPRCTSSTLTILKVSVKTFDDCLYLLDGRFASLSTLIIYVENISSISTTIDKKKKLPKLKHFSLTSFLHTMDYDDEIVSLLRRMINLEELILSVLILRYNSTDIDGIGLYDDILIFMSRLNKFTFNIQTDLFYDNIETALPSDEDIERRFIGKRYGKVASHVEIISVVKGHSRCRIYSLPYKSHHFFFLRNTFQGGIFDNVRCLIMKDSCPFECHFFKVISQHFPFLTELCILNMEPQKDKQQPTTPVTFPQLILLHIVVSHVDYAEQFLVPNNCHLPRLLNLEMLYEPLAMAANNFTNDATRLACAQLTRLTIKEPFVRTENFDAYFPLL